MTFFFMPIKRCSNKGAKKALAINMARPFVRSSWNGKKNRSDLTHSEELLTNLPFL